MHITHTEWVETYRPTKNQLVPNAPFEGSMFETFGKELAHVQSQPKNQVWTVLDVDGDLIISDGFHFVNRMGYIITEVPYTNDEPLDVYDDEDLANSLLATNECADCE